MPLVKAICTCCGAPLTVDQDKDAAICPFCSTPYVVEKAINLYQTNIGTVVNMVQPDQTERCFKNARTQLKLEEFEDAYSSFRKLSATNAGDPRSWDGLLSALSQNKTKDDYSAPQFEELTRYYKNLKTIDEKAAEKWTNYYEHYKGKFENTVQFYQDRYSARVADYENVVRRNTLIAKAVNIIPYISVIGGLLSLFIIVPSCMKSGDSGQTPLVIMFEIVFVLCLLAFFISIAIGSNEKERQRQQAEARSQVNDIVNKARDYIALPYV